MTFNSFINLIIVIIVIFYMVKRITTIREKDPFFSVIDKTYDKYYQFYFNKFVDLSNYPFIEEVYAAFIIELKQKKITKETLNRYLKASNSKVRWQNVLLTALGFLGINNLDDIKQKLGIKISDSVLKILSEVGKEYGGLIIILLSIFFVRFLYLISNKKFIYENQKRNQGKLILKDILEIFDDETIRENELSVIFNSDYLWILGIKILKREVKNEVWWEVMGENWIFDERRKFHSLWELRTIYTIKKKKGEKFHEFEIVRGGKTFIFQLEISENNKINLKNISEKKQISKDDFIKEFFSLKGIKSINKKIEGGEATQTWEISRCEKQFIFQFITTDNNELKSIDISEKKKVLEDGSVNKLSEIISCITSFSFENTNRTIVRKFLRWVSDTINKQSGLVYWIWVLIVTVVVMAIEVLITLFFTIFILYASPLMDFGLILLLILWRLCGNLTGKFINSLL